MLQEVIMASFKALSHNGLEGLSKTTRNIGKSGIWLGIWTHEAAVITT
jgi:hypothetical protein